MASSSHTDLNPVTLPVFDGSSTVARAIKSAEIDGVLSVADILSLPRGPRTDFTTIEGEDQVNEAPLIGEVGISQLREQWDIPRSADIILARSEERVHIDHPGYCVFYAYPFRLGFRIPLPSLVVDFCRYYEVFPSQLVPSFYKLFAMLAKHAELARREIMLHTC